MHPRLFEIPLIHVTIWGFGLMMVCGFLSSLWLMRRLSGRAEPYLHVPPSEYAQFYTQDGRWYPKPLEALTEQQRYDVTRGEYRCLPIHPTQLYASGSAFAFCGVLYLRWRRTLVRGRSDRWGDRLRRPGIAVAGLCLLYGPARFVLEAIRDDNPYEWGTLTISQIMGLVMLVAGVVLLGVLLTGKGDAREADLPTASSGGH